MKKIFLFLLLATLLLTAAGCGKNKGDSLEDTGEAHGLLWRVEDEDTVIYLLGTIHVINDTALPFGEQLTEILTTADALILEADFDDFEQYVYYESSMHYTSEDENRLPDEISEELLDQLMDIYLGHVSLEQEMLLGILQAYRPWALANELAMVVLSENEELALRQEDINIALQLGRVAHEAGVTIREIEGFRRKADMIAALDDAFKVQYLQDTVDFYLGSSPRSEGEIQMTLAWLDAWRRRDTEAFIAATNLDYVSPLTVKLLEESTPAMYDYALNIMNSREGQYVIAIDALHMVTETGLVERFKQDGYEVTVVPRAIGASTPADE
ncbi:MAG: TraB/GumN family protein [Defluviitaleaceae bacterium]|nr:TraB/GumN family protein [Defluviitaleaceae bacterium]